MRTTSVLTMGVLSMMVGTGLFVASNAFATDAHLTSQGEQGTVETVTGDQRIVEIVSPHLSSDCLYQSMVSGDQRRPDRQMTDSEGSRILSPVKTDECTETGYTMPMSH
jgi:hypothetical protein